MGWCNHLHQFELGQRFFLEVKWLVAKGQQSEVDFVQAHRLFVKLVCGDVLPVGKARLEVSVVVHFWQIWRLTWNADVQE
jgi:hypothetical protein